MNSNPIVRNVGTGQAAQVRQDVEPTNTDKPVDLMKVDMLEQNTLLGKFSGDTSEAK